MAFTISSLALALTASPALQPKPATNATEDLATVQSRITARIESSPALPFQPTEFPPPAPMAGTHVVSVSGVAIASSGTVYEVQRGNGAAPVVALDAGGRVLRSWGRGQFALPHSIVLDQAGKVWTVDAGSSVLREFTQRGRLLKVIRVSAGPDNGSPFRGTTGLAFGPHRRLYVADGYSNARVLEYSETGKLLRSWGRPGSGPGEFNLPHAIAVGNDGTVYIADRENGRVERFDEEGKYLGETAGLGRVYALALRGDTLWATAGRADLPPGTGGSWVLKLDAHSGRLLGHLKVLQERSGHGLALSPDGEPVVTAGGELIWFRRE